MTPTRSYTPIRRPGARVPWPPDDSWSVADLLAEMAFWRNYGALRCFSGDKQPRPAAVVIPAQRTRPQQDRIDRLARTAFGVRRAPRTTRSQQGPSTPYSGGTR